MRRTLLDLTLETLPEIERRIGVARARRERGAGMLRRAREEQGLSAEDVAAAIGVKATTIRQLEGGHQRPGEATLAKWTALLGLDHDRVSALVRCTRHDVA